MEIKENFLYGVEWLPDGTPTDDQKSWLEAWGKFVGKQFIRGKINLFEIDGFNEETGEVPNTFIQKIYEETRKSN